MQHTIIINDHGTFWRVDGILVPIVTCAEYAEKHDCSRQWVTQLVKSGKIESIKIGSSVLVVDKDYRCTE